MNFSFCLPSRGAKEPLFKMLDSFERTTRHKDKIEFLIAVDEGCRIEDLVRKRGYSFKISFFERPKTEDFTNDYYNWLADRASGKVIAAFNDDAWMRTYWWDEKLLRRIDNIPHSIFFLNIPDTAQIKYKHYFPCFPFVSRRAFCTLGYLLFRGVKMFPADQYTFEVYRNVNRIFTVNDILIEHEHIQEADPSKSEMMRIFKEDTGNKDISIDIIKLLYACSTDFKAKKSKLKRIIEILTGD